MRLWFLCMVKQCFYLGAAGTCPGGAGCCISAALNVHFTVILFPKQLEAEDSLKKREGKSSQETWGNSLADNCKVVGPVSALQE